MEIRVPRGLKVKHLIRFPRCSLIDKTIKSDLLPNDVRKRFMLSLCWKIKALNTESSWTIASKYFMSETSNNSLDIELEDCSKMEIYCFFRFVYKLHI